MSQHLDRPLGLVQVWGMPSGSVPDFADTFARLGPEGVAGWPGSWAATLERPGDVRLFVAVDAFAGVPLFVRGGRASVEPAALLDGAVLVDRGSVARHLSFGFDAPERTWVQGLFRVPAGFGGWTTGTRTQLARIWMPGAHPAPSDPEQALRDAVNRSIEDRHPELGDTIALSGGLDSSILAGLLSRRGGFRTASNRFVGWAADEGRWIEEVRRHTGLEGLDVASTTLDPLEVIELLGPPGPPPVIVNHHLNLALCRAGGKRLWTGFGGDEVFGHGFDVVRERVGQGRVLSAAWQAAWLAGRYRHEAISMSRSARRWAGRLWYALQDDLGKRDNPERPRGNAARRLEWMVAPVNSRSREEQLRLAAAVGVELVMPYLDARIAEVMMRVPTGARVERGRTRAVLRRAFADVLPPGVRRRSDKADLSQSFDAPFSAAAALWGPQLETALLDPWISPLERISLRRAFDEGDSHAGAALWRAVGAARWLSWHSSLGVHRR